MPTAKKSGGGRKIGRMRAWCKQYRDRAVRERNRNRRHARHLNQFPEDTSNPRHPDHKTYMAKFEICRAANNKKLSLEAKKRNTN